MTDGFTLFARRALRSYPHGVRLLTAGILLVTGAMGDSCPDQPRRRPKRPRPKRT